MLAIENVFKTFQQVRAVDGVSFEVRSGEIFGFLGPNGAGKTTTLRMLMGITRPDSGAVRFDGASEPDRTRIGYLPEERGLYDDAGTLDTMIYLGTLRGLTRADARARALRWLERLELADRAKAKVNTLSKGNQQKIQFAGAVLHEPALVVLDEPFSGLDPLNQELFKGVIRDLRDKGAAVLLSAHHLDLVERLCDRFLLISRGRTVLQGTLEQMRREVAGGASEVLTAELRLRQGGDAAAQARACLAATLSGAESRVEDGAEGRLRLEVALPASVDLGPLLQALGERFRVERVQMRPLSLHEIYVRAVKGGDAAPEAGLG